MKKRVLISIDEDVHKWFQENNKNLSKYINDKLLREWDAWRQSQLFSECNQTFTEYLQKHNIEL